MTGFESGMRALEPLLMVSPRKVRPGEELCPIYWPRAFIPFVQVLTADVILKRKPFAHSR